MPQEFNSCTEDPQILSVAVQNLVAPDLCTSGYENCNYLCFIFDTDPVRISTTTGYIQLCLYWV
jgi:hypothetical protein